MSVARGRLPVRRTGGRAACAALALSLALAATLHWRAVASVHAGLLQEAESTAVPPTREEIRRAIRAEADPGHARLAFARALLADEIDTRWLGAISSADLAGTIAGSLPRLERARDLAAAELERRPASWQAAMILGGATYLGWSRQQDKRLFRERAAWEEPLRAAVALAPGNPEPRRLLGAAYLETWYANPPERREEARGMLAMAFEDPLTFERLIEPWLDIARDPLVAFSIVPPLPEAWDRLQRIFANRQDWPRYREARTGWERELRESLAATLAEADRHLDGGDAVGARHLYLRVAAGVPPDLRYAELFEHALRRCPPGPAGREALPNLERWLALTLELALRGIEPLPPAIVARLAGAVGSRAAADSALAAVAAHDLAAAELYERRAGALRTEAWGAYLIAKARALLQRQELAAAREALALTHRAWRSTAAFWLASEELAVASQSASDRAHAAKQLAAYRRETWPRTAWRWDGPRARLELLAARAAPALLVAVDVADPAGGVVEISWDGGSIGFFETRAGDTLRLPVEVTAGLHLLSWETVAGSRVVPGTVWL
jgi:hypothetical protein